MDEVFMSACNQIRIFAFNIVNETNSQRRSSAGWTATGLFSTAIDDTGGPVVEGRSDAQLNYQYNWITNEPSVSWSRTYQNLPLLHHIIWHLFACPLHSPWSSSREDIDWLAHPFNDFASQGWQRIPIPTFDHSLAFGVQKPFCARSHACSLYMELRLYLELSLFKLPTPHPP